MNKYVTPTIKYEEIEATDVILSSGVAIAALDGVDSDGEKSAIFNASFWNF